LEFPAQLFATRSTWSSPIIWQNYKTSRSSRRASHRTLHICGICSRRDAARRAVADHTCAVVSETTLEGRGGASPPAGPYKRALGGSTGESGGLSTRNRAGRNPLGYNATQPQPFFRIRPTAPPQRATGLSRARAPKVAAPRH